MFSWYPEYEYLCARTQLVLFTLGMGMTLSLGDFVEIARRPRAFATALLGQLLFGPCIAVLINAVTKGSGENLIPEHDETASGQQEVFFVHQGAVDATLDGETMRLEAGAFVAVDPATRRQFDAAATPTTLVAVGSPVGRAYELPGWEQ